MIVETAWGVEVQHASIFVGRDTECVPRVLRYPHRRARFSMHHLVVMADHQFQFTGQDVEAFGLALVYVRRRADPPRGMICSMNVNSPSVSSADIKTFHSPPRYQYAGDSPCPPPLEHARCFIATHHGPLTSSHSTWLSRRDITVTLMSRRDIAVERGRSPRYIGYDREYLRYMPRWEHGSKERLQQAAMELFEEQGV